MKMFVSCKTDVFTLVVVMCPHVVFLLGEVTFEDGDLSDLCGLSAHVSFDLIRRRRTEEPVHNDTGNGATQERRVLKSAAGISSCLFIHSFIVAMHSSSSPLSNLDRSDNQLITICDLKERIQIDHAALKWSMCVCLDLNVHILCLQYLQSPVNARRQ